MARRRDEWLAVLLAVLAGAPLLAGRCYGFDDAAFFALPLFTVVEHAVRAGRVLAWAPDLFGGYNVLGAGQSGLCYPSHWLLLSICGLITAFRLSYVLHFWLLARGLLGLARRLGLTTLGALALAAGGTLGGAVTGHVMHFNVIIGLAWTAPILWLTAILAAEPEPGWAGGLLAAAVGLSLLQSHPQYVVTACLLSFALLPWLRSPAVGWRTVLWRLCLAWAGGAALAAVQILPLLEYARANPRPNQGGHFAWFTAQSFEPRDWLRLFVPEAFGSPWRGGVAFSVQFWEGRCFPGLTFVALAVAGACPSLHAQTPSERVTRAGLALTVGAALLMIGRYDPLWHVLCYVPPLSWLRAPERLLWCFQLGLALLAAGGLTALAAHRLPRRAAWRGALTVAAGVLAALLASAATGHLAAPGALGWSMAALGLGAALSLPFLSGRRAAMALAAVGLLELTVSWHTVALTKPGDWFRAPRFAAIVAADANPRLYELDLVTDLERHAGEARDQLQHNLGLIYGVSYLYGDDSLQPLGNMGVVVGMDRAARQDPRRFKAALDRRSVRWLTTARDRDDLGLELVARDGPFRLYRNPDARPWAYAIDPRWHNEAGVFTPSEVDARIEPVDIVRREAGHWELRTHFERPMAVVVSQSLYTGWSVSVDGRPQQMEGAEMLFMSTVVPAGEHTVAFVFDNFSIWLGAYLSKLALGAWLLWMVGVAWLRLKRPAAGSGGTVATPVPPLDEALPQ
jgi:hypothetical protein